ncbi:MAG: dipeptidase PepV [Clostridiales bacterium]|nr:dipeptidase PepV [Clostridiales bacterium]
MNFDRQIENMKNDIIESVQKIVQIKSVEDKTHPVYPFGQGVQNTLEYTLTLADSLGFKTKNIDNMVGYAEYGQGKEMIGILVHLDVVPEGDGWSSDPYSGEIVDGKIFGRGTTDDKGPAISSLYAVKALMDSNITFTKRVRIIFGLNEETHWESINYYIAHEEIPTMSIVPDGKFPVIYGEKGIIIFDLVKNFSNFLDDGGIEILKISGGNAPNMVPDHAEAIIRSKMTLLDMVEAYNLDYNGQISIEALGNDEYKVVSRGVSAHGSRPDKGINAISHLIKFLDNIDLQISDQSLFIRTIARHIGLEFNGQNIGCGFSDIESGKLVLNVGMIKMNQEKGALTINIRYPVTGSYDAVVNGIKETIDYGNFEYIEDEHILPLFVDKNSDMIQILTKVYNDYTEREDQPLTTGGGTYARSMPNAVAFGATFPWQDDLAHQKNEFISIDDLILMTKIYSKAIYELLK